MAAFTLSFWRLLKIGEIALSKGNNAGQILAVDDVKLTLNKRQGKCSFKHFVFILIIANTWQNGY
jgi:hypothetical protein